MKDSHESTRSRCVPKRREPKCTKCRNHCLITRKKGHKGLCAYESCHCPKCRNTDEKRVVLREQIRIRRHLEQEEKHRMATDSIAEHNLILSPTPIEYYSQTDPNEALISASVSMSEYREYGGTPERNCYSSEPWVRSK